MDFKKYFGDGKMLKMGFAMSFFLFLFNIFIIPLINHKQIENEDIIINAVFWFLYAFVFAFIFKKREEKKD